MWNTNLISINQRIRDPPGNLRIVKKKEELLRMMMMNMHMKPLMIKNQKMWVENMIAR